MEKINIAELLKDCPQGMELYSPIFGNVYLEKIRPYLEVVVSTSDKQKKEFLYDGRFGINGECMLFPSKENRDWSKFQRPFKDGDVCTTMMGTIFIYKKITTYNYCGSYVSFFKGVLYPHYDSYPKDCCHLATEEEKQKLFDAIKANGYKWNADKKELEKLIVPKFKVGDRIKWIKTGNIHEIIKILSNCYIANYLGADITILFDRQDEYELVPNKFDINTLKPFDKVLVRNEDECTWRNNFYGLYKREFGYPFICIGQVTIGYKQCIPYEGNQHLLGTKNDCSDFYKTWEE